MLSSPLVSVVMPVRNEAAFIQRSLGAVLNQDYPADCIEILIADGMSDDQTIALIQQLAGSERVRIMPNPQRIQAAGLNRIIPQAAGKYIVRVDGHTIIAPDYIRQCVAALQASGAYTVGGAMNPVGITRMGKAIALAATSAFAVPSTFRTSQTAQYTDTVYLGAWPRSVFEQVGLYNLQVGVNEDYELNHRIRQAGGKIYFSPTICSEYYGRQTLSALARQYYRYGISKVKTLMQHPGSLRLRQIIAPIFVAALIGGLLLAVFSPLFLLLWAIMLLLYGILAIVFAVKATWNKDRSLLWLVPIIFLTIHIAWGLGFWIGLLRLNQPFSRS